MENVDSGPDGAATSASDFRLEQIFRSDVLAQLNELRKVNPVLREVVEEPIQVLLVLDACIVQQELRFRLRHKRKPEARSALQEILDSKTVLPFAPPALMDEIEEHVEEIAIYARVSIAEVREEWEKFQTAIHFYEPEKIQDPIECVDPDDVPYRQVCFELGARAVYTKNAGHFRSMQTPVITIDLDRVLRKHARATSVKLAVTIGSSFTLTISINVLKDLFKLAARGVRRIPTPLKVAFLLVVAAAFIHPQSRNKIIAGAKKLWEKLNHPAFRALLSSLAIQTFEAHETAKTTFKEIEAALPSAPKRHAISFARQICAIEKRSLSVAEIASRMKEAGYVTKSRTFAVYLRRLLKASANFVETSPGYWVLKMHAGKAA